MKKVPLTQGQFALVDDEDYEWLMQWKWFAMKTPHGFVAVRNRGSWDEPGTATIYMHREIMETAQGMEVDHIDHNKLNDQRYNLRNCSALQNKCNKRSYYGTSKYKGVSWNKKANKWMSRIASKGEHIHLGYYDDEEEAARVYDEAAKELFGEFAELNFPEEVTV